MSRKKNNGDGTEDLFEWGDGEEKRKWESRDHFGSKEAGMEAAREATPPEWLMNWFWSWQFIIESVPADELAMTSQDATDICGLPQAYGGHPSSVGANTDKTAERFGLVPKGKQAKARGRRVHWNTIWGWPDGNGDGVEVDLDI